MKTKCRIVHALAIVAGISLVFAVSACSRGAQASESTQVVTSANPTDAPAQPGDPQLIPTTAGPQLPTDQTGESQSGDLGTPVSPVGDSPTPSSGGGGGSGGAGGSGSQSPTQTPIVVTTVQPGGGGGGGSADPQKPPISTPKPPTPTQGPPPPVAAPDTSGPQSQLSTFEEAAQAAKAATYTGQRCRIDITNAQCNCPTETARSEFVFPSTNDLTWLNELSTGLQTFNLARMGINTWTTSRSTEIGPVQVVLIFLQNGYQYTTSTTLKDGRQVVCPSVWTR